MSTNQAPPTRAQARQRVKAMQAAQAAEERRRQQAVRVVVAVVVIAVIVGLGVLWQMQRSMVKAGAAPQAVTRTADGIVVGDAKDAPQVDVWEDFQCPHCKTFEAASGEKLMKLAAGGKARVVYHTLAFLGPESQRAANAAACAVDAGKFPEYHATLFNNQPIEGTGGFTNEDLVKLGKNVGITDDAFAQCVNSGKYNQWVKDQTEKNSVKWEIYGTPTLYVQGVRVTRNPLEEQLPSEVDVFDPAALTKAVESYRGKPMAPAPNPSMTPLQPLQ
ncbi:hypothetical protein C3Y87_06950 [Carbonactinospora thermoautotrophica]|uniref:DsbA family protein n=1 Tax=Carbonactinospora thermoautotrophica TaxID=1469144 RepID=UPI00226EC5F4|nr:thioredoxin domain-containing protein [Carbonactinospora thermoautotrophica]MCX9191150.1 hypothetical protein [Carbonactinospora thermoautotrophica]